jgi:hypothetical protein
MAPPLRKVPTEFRRRSRHRVTKRRLLSLQRGNLGEGSRRSRSTKWIEKLREDQEKHGVIYVDSIGEVFKKRHLGSAMPAVRLRPGTHLFPVTKSEPRQGS